MEDIEEKSTIAKIGVQKDNNKNSEKINDNVPRTAPNIIVNDNVEVNNTNDDEKQSPNFVANSENNDENDEPVDELSNIVPGSIKNKIKQFEIIQEEKNKEKLPPIGKNRRAFRSRVDSTQMYKRESLALLTSNPENKLRIQTVISQLFNNQNIEELNIPGSNLCSPISSSANNRASFNKLKENYEENNNSKRNSTISEKTNESESSTTNDSSSDVQLPETSKINSEEGRHIRYSIINKPKRYSDQGAINNRNNLFDKDKHLTVRSQDSPLRITSNLQEMESESDVEKDDHNVGFVDSKSLDMISVSPLNKYNFKSQQNINKPSDIIHNLSSSSNDLVNSETDDSLGKMDDIGDIDNNIPNPHKMVSDPQLNNSSAIKILKKQFVPITSKKNSKANIKSIHVKGSGEHIIEKSSWDSINEEYTSSGISRISEHSIQPSEIRPLQINTKMTSDTNLYHAVHNELILSSKSSKSFVAIPNLVSKKAVVRKNSRPAEVRHIKKKSSVSTTNSEESLASPATPLSANSDRFSPHDKFSTFNNEKPTSKLANEYDADILYEYFDEDSNDEDNNNLINSDATSIQNLPIENKVPNLKSGNLSIKTNIQQNLNGLNSSEITTSGVTPLDQVYNSISQELEQRLCQTVRHSVLQKIESNNFMIPINILYEKHYKTQVIYVERRMTIEEVLLQALNSINIYEDYDNYELLQIFGFEDIIEEEDEENNNSSMEELRSPVSPIDGSTRFQNVLDPSEKIQDIVDNMQNISNRKNTILTFRIRKKTSTMKITIFLEEEKKYGHVMVTKSTTSADVIEALLFLQNEPYTENGWFIQRKSVDNYEDGKEILEPTDILYNKEEKYKYILKRKKSKQMSKLVNILGVTDENDLHNIIESKKKKDKDKTSKNANESLKVEPLQDYNEPEEEITEEKIKLFSRILGLTKDEVNHIYMKNKSMNDKKKMELKKKAGSVDQLNNCSNNNLKDDRFSSQMFNIFKSKKEKRLSKLRDSIGTGSMPILLKDDNSQEEQTKMGGSGEFISSNEDIHAPGKRAKKLGNFFGVKPSQRENTELNNIIRKNYNSKKTLDSSQQYVVIRVYFANLTYTTINMSINDTCKTAKKILCERLGVKESDEGLYQIYEFTQKNGYERELHSSERPFDTMRRWQKDEIFLFKLKNNNVKKKTSHGNICDKSKNKYEMSPLKSPIMNMSETNLAGPGTSEQPVRRMAKLAGFFGVVNSKQEEKNNIESEEEVKELFNMLHVMSNSKEEATNQIIKFIHSNDVISSNSVKEGWLNMQVGKCWINSWCYKDNVGAFNIKNWKSGDMMRIILSDIVSAELNDGKSSSSSSGDNIFNIVVKKDGCGPPTQYLFKAKFVIDAIEWVTALKPSTNKTSSETQKVIIEDDSNFKDNFDAMNIIGKGKYSVVFLCKQLSTAEPYAVKILNNQYKDMWEVEKEILKSITHPFIVDIFQAFEYEDHSYLVMEFINGGDLYFHLSQYGRFSEIRVRFYAAEILLALESLHGRDIIYRDLKLENIMITKEGHIKLVDFGQSVPKLIMNIEEVSSMSNIEYIAPEILCGKTYSFASDWWAFGVIIYEMLCEKHPFYSSQKEEIVQRILQSPIDFPSFPSRYIKDLILKLLNRDSEKRLGCSSEGGKEIQNHPFFEKIDFTKLYHLEIKPPFKPNVEDAFDIQYFDTQFTEEPISNNLSEGNLYDDEDDNYNYDNNNDEGENYDYEQDEDNYDNNRQSHYSYDKERNTDEVDDNYNRQSKRYSGMNHYSSMRYEPQETMEYVNEENENNVDDNYNRQSKRYSNLNHFSMRYEPQESMEYVNEENESNIENDSTNSLNIQQQRLNNGWGDEDDDIIDDNNNHQYSMDEKNYTKSYIEKQEQRIKNGW
ncbi:hypothetical protein BCR32DRAFT_273124 [Anaeromyces robustus]|uniref:Non-specific serine/threonine protein kinase n=1 Tax=Anaeromyces robustus TaxID=1754192 RepID=A0A1Y1VTN1_9FUNG|nr:hypothetical protein BCR32DRAFT_273124 [Anaeromyces robustus]|eukprot:ORX64376.1 hypothetical protein BCR32DRAFT_273124 [Anaeromyces robustus]